MQFVKRMLIERRQRLVGTLMRYMEDEIYPKLSEPERKDLRRRVLTAVDAYHEVCLDLLKASIDDGMSINDEAVRMLSRLNSAIDTLRGSHG